MFFIRQLMYFPSGILLHKNLPIYSMVNRISFCFRNLIFFLYSCLINLKNFPLFIVCGNKFYFGHVFIRQFMHFPSGILLYKNLPIHSMVNLISFCSRNSMFLPSKSETFPLLIVCRIWFHFGPLLRSAGKAKKHNNDSYVLQSIMHRWSINLSPGKNVLRDEEKFPLIYSMSNPFEFYRRFCFNPLVVERADPNEPDYFETIYPSIHSMVKQVAFWSMFLIKTY